MSPGRRGFLFAALASALPGIAPGQPAPRRVVCFDCGGARLEPAMAALGWKQGANFSLAPRRIGGGASRGEVEEAAREVVAQAPDAIVCFMREHAGALVRATRTIPIVAGLHDPVLEGFAESVARPGGNVTGIAFSSPESVKMTFRLLGASVPGLRRIHTLEPRGWNETPTVGNVRREIATEKGFVFQPHVLERTGDALRVLEGIRSPREEALVLAAPLEGFDYAAFAARILQARVPALDMTGRMEAAALLSAGLRHSDVWARLAAIVDKVLRGASPASIPFEQPTHAEVILNRRVAAAIGVAFPPDLVMRATRIIE